MTEKCKKDSKALAYAGTKLNGYDVYRNYLMYECETLNELFKSDQSLHLPLSVL